MTLRGTLLSIKEKQRGFLLKTLTNTNTNTYIVISFLIKTQNKQEANKSKMNQKKWLPKILDNPKNWVALRHEPRRNKIPWSINPIKEEIKYFQFQSDETLEISATTHDQQK